MATKDPFLNSFTEKFAGWLNHPIRRLRATSRLYTQKANAPAQKVRKVVGAGLLGAGAAGYGVHQLTKDPDEQMMQRRPEYAQQAGV